MSQLILTVPGSGSGFSGTGLGKVGVFPSISRNGSPVVSTTSGSPNVTITTGALYAGQSIAGPGIPSGATVTTGAGAGGTAVLSVNATATATNITVITTGFILPFAGYLFGTAYNNQPYHDWSGNGRDLATGGSPAPGSLSTVLSKTNFVQTPFVGNDLTALNNEATIIAVAKAATGVNNTEWVTNQPTSTGLPYLRITSNGANTYAQNYTDASAGDLAQPVIPSIDSDQAAHFSMFALTATKTASTVYRMRSDKAALAISATKNSGAVGGASKFLHGGSYGSSAATPEEAMGLYYPISLTSDEIENTVFPALVNIFAAYGGVL